MTEVRCRRCSQVLGQHDDDREEFRVGPLAVRTPFRWRCLTCGYVHHWRPGDDRRPPEGVDAVRGEGGGR